MVTSAKVKLLQYCNLIYSTVLSSCVVIFKYILHSPVSFPESIFPFHFYISFESFV